MFIAVKSVGCRLYYISSKISYVCFPCRRFRVLTKASPAVVTKGFKTLQRPFQADGDEARGNGGRAPASVLARSVVDIINNNVTRMMATNESRLLSLFMVRASGDSLCHLVAETASE